MFTFTGNLATALMGLRKQFLSVFGLVGPQLVNGKPHLQSKDFKSYDYEM